MQVCCSSCHSLFDVEPNVPPSNLQCPSCGSTITAPTETISYYFDSAETLGHFRLLDKLGMGAFGTVWKAHDSKLDRIVAVKIPRKESLSATEQEQFLREARAAGQLSHPNIVSVHEVGRQNDSVYIVSDYVDGVSLSDWLSARKMTPREAAELCGKIAGALHHAHDAGVIHRDLKPSNIMLDASREPYIMDFGLAKRETGELTMTVEGRLLGTPAYMSPEQARGEGHRADRRSDVYSLGVILYELLAGERPFGGNMRMLLHQVLHDDPPGLRSKNSKVSRDLETICLKCLQKDPEMRYQTAGDLGEDLKRFSAGEAILARPESSAAKLWRKLKRNRVAAWGVLAVMLAIGVTSYAVSIPARQATALMSRIQLKLESLDFSEADLRETESLVSELASIDPEAADQQQNKLLDRFAQQAVEKRLEEKLTNTNLDRIETAMALLSERNYSQLARIREKIDDRRTQWHEVFSLPKDGRLSDVFVSNAIHPNGRTLVRALPETGVDSNALETRIPSQQNVRLNAMFVAKTWLSASEIGLVLNQQAEGGYRFSLKVISTSNRPASETNPTFEHLQRSGGEVGLLISRNGKLLRVRRFSFSELPTGDLTIVATRVGHDLSVRIIGLEELSFFDPIPLPEEAGHFGVIWPAGAELTSLVGEAQFPPSVETPLEKGDRLFSRGPDFYDDALAFYRSQSRQAQNPSVMQEAAYKEALCLMALGQDREAAEILSGLVGEKGTRWPLAARFQLTLAWIRLGNMKKFDELFESFRFIPLTDLDDFIENPLPGKGLEAFARLVPAETFREAFELAMKRYGGADVIRFDRDHILRVERLLALSDHLDISPDEHLKLALVLGYGYRTVGKSQKAHEFLKATLSSERTAHCSSVWLYHLVCLYCWTERDLPQADYQGTLALIDRHLHDDAGGYNHELLLLLLARAQVKAHAGDRAGAAKDVDDFLRLMPAEEIRYPDYARAWLLKGFLREAMGDIPGAIDTWKQGTYKTYAQTGNRRVPDDPYSFNGGWSLLLGPMLGSLSNELSEADYNQLMDATIPALNNQFAGLILKGPLRIFSTSLIRKVYQTEEGRDYARRLSIMDLDQEAFYREPVVLLAIAAVRSDAFRRELTKDEEQVVRTACELGFRTFVKELTPIQTSSKMAPLFGVWNDTLGPLGLIGWQNTAPDLPADLRSHVAYLFGRRYVYLKKPKVAATYFRTAVKDSPANSLLSRLAKAELDLIEKPRNPDRELPATQM